ncbi:hypothetical protein IC617_07560 [Neiella sp. HB171785]|uniref:Uncharacterized protein n=1 Tax=Neiella litorisoli TaxID=2771431 RepID=A0A8J6QIJ4_9GAMM|nr:hypothetical protein [Neiella litorisoli]MBD1389277.1 hypothetical protein [Neiella litorisoli]
MSFDVEQINALGADAVGGVYLPKLYSGSLNVNTIMVNELSELWIIIRDFADQHTDGWYLLPSAQGIGLPTGEPFLLQGQWSKGVIGDVHSIHVRHVDQSCWQVVELKAEAGDDYVFHEQQYLTPLSEKRGPQIVAQYRHWWRDGCEHFAETPELAKQAEGRQFPWVEMFIGFMEDAK